jgi:hypothetical protein
MGGIRSEITLEIVTPSVYLGGSREPGLEHELEQEP